MRGALLGKSAPITKEKVLATQAPPCHFTTTKKLLKAFPGFPTGQLKKPLIRWHDLLWLEAHSKFGNSVKIDLIFQTVRKRDCGIDLRGTQR